MATIKIHIDSESHEIDGNDKHVRVLAAVDKVGLISSVPVSTEMREAFNDGLGQRKETGEKEFADEEPGIGYKAQPIKDAKDRLKGKNCKVIATAGGTVVCSALSGESGARMPPYVSLVGHVPDVLGQCRGGVSLESAALNPLRQSYLVSNGHTKGNVVLLTNKNSAMHGKEKEIWTSDPNDPTFIESYAGDGLGNNDAAKIPWDFGADGHEAKILARATGLIISDDPFFQTNRYALINLVNAWLDADAQRAVIYPSKIYEKAENGAETIRPTHTRSIIYGPDLLSAYQLLGILAHRLVRDKDIQFGFFTLASKPEPVLSS